MPETIDVLTSHRSDRHYLSTPIADDVLNNIIAAAWRAPTSVNSQQVTLVVVRDAGRRAEIAALAGGQPWIAQAPVFIAVVLDMHKSDIAIRGAGKQQLAHLSVESIVAGATDAGIALEAMMVAARAQGLGIVPIGGIRANPRGMSELLKLPPLTFPVVGLTLGYVDQPAPQKPRLPLSSFCHEEYYHDERIAPAIEEYNQVLARHWQEQQRADGDDWGNNTASYYSHIYFPDVLAEILRQGFKLDK
ncbi:NADPH-dependent oxidoreductase [Shimwellia pseudoproteus]|uniref:NADPH-dependent oxidoreductase n=1 Tax=Shimwellia pseudoproteus TaxID=570012 RepID=UPI0018EDB4D5|nr:NADPH-dependent oxidoreductase [Shimwellia pseudoproteus]MBJ3814566.1 NADPH-dependent oxidoreductase [Shimwellia pseudoproteus]